MFLSHFVVFVFPGPEGLGFTVVTRDSSLHGPGPVLVKNILPRGAAVKDGRLQSGDRILEVQSSWLYWIHAINMVRQKQVILTCVRLCAQVNGVDITGVGQEELVCMLRSTRQGESVCLVVLRQEDMFLPREMVRTNHTAALLINNLQSFPVHLCLLDYCN